MASISEQSHDPRQMYGLWMRMWNGGLDLTDELVAPGCVVHQPPNDFRGPEDVLQMVEMGRAPFTDIMFRIEVEPIVEGDRLAARWIAKGAYADGIPGTTAEPGTEIAFSGMDIWRIEDDIIAEYWVSSDGLHMMAQLNPE